MKKAIAALITSLILMTTLASPALADRHNPVARPTLHFVSVSTGTVIDGTTNLILNNLTENSLEILKIVIQHYEGPRLDKASPKLAEALATWFETTAQLSGGEPVAATATARDSNHYVELFTVRIDSDGITPSVTINVSGTSKDGSPIHATAVIRTNSPPCLSIDLSASKIDYLFCATLNIAPDCTVSVIPVTGSIAPVFEIFQNMVHCRQIH